MNTNNKHPHFSRTVLHNGEERVKRIFRDQLAELAGLLEVGISLLVVVALMLAVVPLIKMLPGLLVDTNEVEISLFLQRALDIVIGIEFIKMLAKHSPGSALEVLLYAIARHMIVGHESAVENFISVASIALIFFVRKFLFVPAFGATMPGGRKAPSARQQQLSIHYLCADYTQLHMNSRFHIITLIYCDFGVLSAVDRKKLLASVYSWLQPEGVLLFDVFLPSRYDGVPESKTWEITEDGFWADERCLTLHDVFRYEEDNTVLNRYIAITEDDIRQFHVWEHTFTKAELQEALQEAGFTSIAFFRDMNGNPCGDYDQTMCIAACKSRTDATDIGSDG